MSAPISPVPAGVRVRVPAKINLALCVGTPARRRVPPAGHRLPGGVAVRRGARLLGRPGRVRRHGHRGGCRPGADRRRNLAVRAARLLADRYGEGQPLGVSLAIHKSIPVAGGLAGGSSNGAAALLACSDLWALDVSLEQMLVAGRRARQRRAVRAARRYGAGKRPRRAGGAGAGPRARTTGSSASAGPVCPRPRSTGPTTSCVRTHRCPRCRTS